MRVNAASAAALFLGILVPDAWAGDIHVDARNLTMPGFLVQPTVGVGLLNTSSIQTLTLDPGVYSFLGRDVNGVAFDFTVDALGHIQYSPTLGGFLAGAGTDTLTVLGYAITIDASALSMPSFSLLFVSGDTTANSLKNTADLYHATVIPGTYTFQGRDVNGVTFDFSVDLAGHVQYPPARAGFLSGAGTPNLVVLGFAISIDSHTLSMPTYTLLFVTGNTTVDSTRHTADLLHVTVIPGSYTFMGRDVNGVTFDFSVDLAGHVQYPSAIAGFLSGAGTPDLIVLGYAITVDARGLASITPSFSVLFVSGDTTAGSLRSTSVTWVFTVIPGSYDLQEGHGGEGFELFFNVDNPGFLRTLPAMFDGQAVTGNGTRVLRIGANAPPVVTAGGNRTILSSIQGTTVLQGIASDPDNDALTYRWLEVTPGGDVVLLGPSPVLGFNASLPLFSVPAFSIGMHTLRLEAADLFGTSTDTIVLTVDDSPPTAGASGGGVFQDGSNVVISGQVSDYDGDPVAFTWTVAETHEILSAGIVMPPFGGAPIAVPQVLLSTTHLGVGSHVIQLTVSDGINAAVVVPVAVNVIDTQLPTLAPVASTLILFPPNHQMIAVDIQANAADNSHCLTLAAVVKSSAQPEYDAHGILVPDSQVVSIDQLAGVIHLLLRAEKSDKGEGRTYTVTITATDCSGNQSIAIVTITAPHNRDHGEQHQ